jgi:hypothetical protein
MNANDVTRDKAMKRKILKKFRKVVSNMLRLFEKNRINTR